MMAFRLWICDPLCPVVVKGACNNRYWMHEGAVALNAPYYFQDRTERNCKAALASAGRATY